MCADVEQRYGWWNMFYFISLKLLEKEVEKPVQYWIVSSYCLLFLSYEEGTI